MEIQIRLYDQDYLTYQLYTASRSPLIRKRRRYEQILTAALFAVAGLIFLLTNMLLLFYYFMGVALLTLAFYPLYARRRYKKHYLRHIRDVFRNNFGRDVKVVFGTDALQTSDAESHSEIKYSQIKEISDIPAHFFVHFNSGSSLIIPKKSLSAPLEVKNKLAGIASDIKVDFNSFPNWKWK